MATVLEKSEGAHSLPVEWTLADLQKHLGGIAAWRIRLFPPPGTATEEDLIELNERKEGLFELVDGTLVEKAMGWYESLLGVLISTELSNFVKTHDLGKVLGADAMLQLQMRLVRLPDVCFISWARFPKGLSRKTPIAPVSPDLAVEVLSKSNTKGEVRRKVKEYFDAEVRLVWLIDPATRSARVYASPQDSIVVDEDGVLDGGDVLPGFRLPLREFFAEADRTEPAGG